MNIRSFVSEDTTAVVALWTDCGLVVPWNDPYRDIERKLSVQPELFLVGEINSVIVAAVMAGYDGHRGWVNYLAVAPQYQRQRLGQQLIDHVELQLKKLGCPKLNLQVRQSNEGVIEFYRQLGFSVDPTISLGKRLIPDEPVNDHFD